MHTQLCSLKIVAKDLLKSSPQYSVDYGLGLGAGALGMAGRFLGEVSNTAVGFIDAAAKSIDLFEDKATKLTEIELYMPGETALADLSFSEDLDLLVSCWNPGAAEAARELMRRFKQSLKVREISMSTELDEYIERVRALKRQSSRLSRDRSSSSLSTATGAAPRFVLYLNDKTWVGDDGLQLAALVRRVLASSIPIVMLHENGLERGGCHFARFFQTTPGDLIDDGIYSEIALALYDGVHREVSLRLVAEKLGARGGRSRFSLVGRLQTRLSRLAELARSKVYFGGSVPSMDAEPEAAQDADQPIGASQDDEPIY